MLNKWLWSFQTVDKPHILKCGVFSRNNFLQTLMTIFKNCNILNKILWFLPLFLWLLSILYLFIAIFFIFWAAQIKCVYAWFFSTPLYNVYLYPWFCFESPKLLSTVVFLFLNISFPSSLNLLSLARSFISSFITLLIFLYFDVPQQIPLNGHPSHCFLS